VPHNEAGSSDRIKSRFGRIIVAAAQAMVTPTEEPRPRTDFSRLQLLRRLAILFCKIERLVGRTTRHKRVEIRSSRTRALRIARPI
jgi:hypothetical protein